MTTALQSPSTLAVEVATSATGSALITTGGAKHLSRQKKSLADFETSIDHYPEPIRSHVRWLQGYWFDACKGNDASLRAIAIKAGHDRSEQYFYNLLNGHNFKTKSGTWNVGGTAWSEFLEIYESIRRYSENAARQGRQEFILTPTYRCIEQFITERRALNAVCKFGGIMHATGGQTTACLKHYAMLNNHGAVIRVEAPANKKLSTLQTKIALRYGESITSLKYCHTREAAVRRNVNETRTLILDNAQNLYIDHAGWEQPMFNWLLELQEDTGCTIILNFTTDFGDKLVAGRAAGYFEQFVGRMGGMQDLLRIPDRMPWSDLKCVARHYGVESKGGLDYLKKWSELPGRCRIVFQRLQRAQQFSQIDGRKNITIADLAEANDYTPPAIGTDTEEEG